MSDPKSPDDESEAGAAEAPSFSKPPAAAAFVVPYESIDEDVPDLPPPASVIVRQSYVNEVPPVVAAKQKHPGEDEETKRVEAIDDAALAELIGDETETHERPTSDEDDEEPPQGPTRRVAVVTDEDLEGEDLDGQGEDGDTAPAVIVDGPSEAYAARNADRCPYCLTFTGLSNARSRGVRYCPMCGADWNSLDRVVEAPSGAVIPLDETEPHFDPELEEHPTNQYTRLGPVRPSPGEPGFVAPPEPPPKRGASPLLMLLTGVSLGLAGTMTVAWLYARRQPPPPTVVSSAPPPVKVSPPVVTPVQDDPPTPPKPVEPEPVEPKPVEPVEPKPVEPVEPKPVEPVKPEPVEPEPVEPATPVVAADMVQAALLDTTSLLPPRALVELRPRIEGNIVFLTGVVDSQDTLGQVVAAVAAVEGVLAVDSRGVRSAWKTYTVVRGDSLSKIAQLYYGDTNAWPRIWRANKDVVPSPGALNIGVELRIPMGRTE